MLLFYSVLNDLMGFEMAAFTACTLMVTKATTRATTMATAKTHQLICMRYANSFSHWFIAHHPTGSEMMEAMTTSSKKSLDRSVTILFTLAPKTFRMPISFIRWDIAKAERPSNPRQAMKIAMHAKMV